MTAAPGRKPQPRVLYMDPHLLIVDKPAGLLVGRGNERVPGLPDSLAGSRHVPADEPFLEIQRGDPGLSGVVVYARTVETRAALEQLFDGREVTAVYDALVQGYVESDGQVDRRIAYDKPRGRLMVTNRKGREALTRYHIRERVLGHTWLEVVPDQLRSEQLRVHLASIGHPLAIDPVYGGVEPLLLSAFKPRYRASARHEERPLIARMTLHLRTLAFTHPRLGIQLHAEAEMPRDMTAAIRQLGRLL